MAGKAKPADVEEEDDKPEGEQSTATSKFKFKLKLPPLKWMIIGAAGFLVLAGGGGGAYFFLKGSDRAKEPQAAVKPATFVDLPDVLVNLSNTGTDRTQYLKVKIVLELPDQTLVPQYSR